MTVADFIDGIMAEDDADFVNTIYRKVYEAYFDLYTAGLTQQQIQNRLLNSEDGEISAVVKELLIDKYNLTIKNFENSLTATSTLLVINVPKSIMIYQRRKLEVTIAALQKDLKEATEAGDNEKVISILTEINGYNKARTHLTKELGRV